MRQVLLAALLCAAAVATAQTSKPAAQSARPAITSKKPAPIATRNECIAPAGLCVPVPATWQKLGDPYGDLGFVVAEPHEGQPQSEWPELNVAVLDPPEQKNGARVTLGQLVDSVTHPGGELAETQQRTHLLLNGSNAEVVRVLLRDADTQAEAIEEVALIEGDGGLVYTFALRCAPQDFERLDPLFHHAIRNWTVTPVPESKDAPANKPEPKTTPAPELPNAPSAGAPEDTKKP